MAEQCSCNATTQNGGEVLMRPELWALAMAFVPGQSWQNIYETDVGFRRGTIFADLDMPFIGEEAVGRGSGT
ncbi:MAG: spore coat associated protein CotJA [Butyricicoccaceae bacterium]